MKNLPFLNSVLSELSNHANSKQNTSVFGLSFGEKALFLCNQKRQVVYVSTSLADGIKLAEMFKSFGKTCKTMLFSPQDYFSLGSKTFGENVLLQIDALFSLSNKKVDCLIVSPTVFMQKFAKRDVFQNSVITLKAQKSYDINQIGQNLINLGYIRTQEVSSPGEFSVFGENLIVFDILSKNPTKIEFFDNEIETISQIDIKTFKKISNETKFIVHPISTFAFDVSKSQNIFEQYIADFEKTSKQLDTNAGIKLKTNFEDFKINFENKNIGYVQNWLYAHTDFDRLETYLDDDALIVFDDVKLVFDAIMSEYHNFNEAYDEFSKSGGILLEQKNFYISESEVFDFSHQLLSFQHITTANRIFSPKFVDSYKADSSTNYFGNMELIKEDMKYYLEFQNTVVLFAGNERFANSLHEMFQEASIPSQIADANSIKFNTINILTDDVPYGGIFVEDKLVVIGSKELQKKQSIKKVTSQNKKDEFTLPKVGDYVVHETHGIGLCTGIEKLKFGEFQKDYIILQYAGGDKLYLPTEQISQISAYISNGKPPKMSKLGSKDFENTKAKVRSSLKQLAFNLMQLYHDRENAKGFKFEVDKGLFEEFENSFAFEETPDQVSAIKDILGDMTSGKVMDRILCGDVGYGKTEVALRSAFVCASNGKQTVFLAPTTVLSQQHFNTAKSRFQNYGITVECLNRFKSKAEQKEIIKKLKNGEIDIVCGTHRLLSSDVGFKDLGLLILDEEQRFGVGDKEKIKRLKTNVDVLTLSATPIPRTLHMGLVGIRDISIISTPPIDRLPVQTTVTEYSDALVLQAIKRELGRDGQVLIIYNKVETIYQFSSHIRSMLGKDIEIGVAHGQMDSDELETQILNLYSGKTKVLVSTTLIENGVDLPSANTLIIIDADKLGLSQLYQLKGRVGRSKNLGYAYFTYDEQKSLSEDAYKRLNAIMEFTELGSGFKIAMKDLEIRGCGNILGAEQSGHMAKVGYDMYCKILNEAVDEIRGQKQREYRDIKLNISANCYIPENYIDDSENRFRVYNNLKKINSSEVQQRVLSEIEDLFGKVPDEIRNLSYVSRLHNIAREFDVKKVNITRESCFAEFYDKEHMLDKSIANALKELGIKVYFSQTGAIMNFMLSEFSVKRKLELLCDIFENALDIKNKKK